MNRKRDLHRLKELGIFLRKIRESMGMSLDDVVSNCEVSKGNLSAIENGKKDYTVTTLLEIAKGLGKHPKKLFDQEFEFLSEWE